MSRNHEKRGNLLKDEKMSALAAREKTWGKERILQNPFSRTPNSAGGANLGLSHCLKREKSRLFKGGGLKPGTPNLF